MLDTFTLLIAAVALFETLGAVLLLAWFASRRPSRVLAVCGAIPPCLALAGLAGWQAWGDALPDSGTLRASLLAALAAVPGAVLAALAFRLAHAEDMLRAMRKARSGRNMHALAPMHALSQEMDIEALEDDLRQAIKAGDQLHILYQPIFDTASRTLAGFEALLRWNHPVRGTIAPMQFIPLAEQTDLIGPLGAWVLETACADAAGWPSSWYLSVNLSPVQIESARLTREVRAALNRSGLPPGRLELEITEGVLVAAAGPEIARLAELRRLGVRVAIDDFGTGYSSLGYLSQLPFDTIKIDRSFVRNMESDDSARAIVDMIVELSRRLGRDIVAEGVETESQYGILAALNCRRVQGWLFGKPMSPRDIGQTFPAPAGGASAAGGGAPA